MRTGQLPVLQPGAGHIRHKPSMRTGQLPVLQPGAGHIRDRTTLHKYADEQDVNGLMRDLANTLFLNRPDNPVAYLHKVLGERLDGQNIKGVDPATGGRPEDKLKEKEAGLLRVQAEFFGDGGVRRRNLSLLVVPSPKARRGAQTEAAGAISSVLRVASGALQGREAGGEGPQQCTNSAPKSAGNDLAAAMIDSAHHTVLSGESPPIAQLRRSIAADPEGFLARSDKDGNGEVTWHEFLQSCRGTLKQMETDPSVEAELRAMFRRLGAHEDKLPLDEFDEKHKAVALFFQQSRCAQAIVLALLEKVNDRRSMSAHGEDDLSAADHMMVGLASLTEQEMRSVLEGSQALAPSSLLLHRDKVKEDLEGRKEVSQELDDIAGGKKFADMSTAVFGDKDAFDKGLEVLGAPHPDVLGQVGRECTESPDSHVEFEAWNSGKNVTTPAKEFDFVVKPFKPGSARPDKPPSEWELNHEYGGRRSPIRLEVFCYALSVGKDFCDHNYKLAHTLDPDNKLWLHEKEVSMVKVILCRLIKSELNGLSLMEAFETAQIQPRNQKQAGIKAERIARAISEVLQEHDGSDSKCSYEQVLAHLRQRDVATEAEMEALLDHFHRKWRGAGVTLVPGPSPPLILGVLPFSSLAPLQCSLLLILSSLSWQSACVCDSVSVSVSVCLILSLSISLSGGS